MRSPENLVDRVREHHPELADQLEAWRCPHEQPFSYALDDFLPPGGRCDARAVMVEHEVSATMIRAEDSAAERALVHGIDVGPPRTREVPMAYDMHFTCERGHRVYIRTESV